MPPGAYGGTERIIDELARGLYARGHTVTTFAAGDSDVPGRLIATVPAALWPAGFTGDPSPYLLATVQAVLRRAREFDLIHSHVEWYSSALAAASPVPVLTTFHGRLDQPWAPGLLGGAGHPVAISRSQASSRPEASWAAIIHNGLSLTTAPFSAGVGETLAFVGRIAPEKGVIDAIEIARLTGRPLRIAAKSGKNEAEIAYLETVFRPALRAAGSLVEWLGEVSREERDRLYAESCATLMPGAWPEPFGLVAIESLACGTPVIARAVGALPEIVRHGVDGFLGHDAAQLAAAVDDVGALDRAAIRASVLERFSADRMVDAYEAVYQRLVGNPSGAREASSVSGIPGAGGVSERAWLPVRRVTIRSMGDPARHAGRAPTHVDPEPAGSSSEAPDEASASRAGG